MRVLLTNVELTVISIDPLASASVVDTLTVASLLNMS